jgi:hypothetical protein
VFAAAIIAALLLAVVAALDVKVAAAGWLVGFVFWCGPPVGSLVWMMIHRLTGGRWGIALHDTFATNAALVPVLGVLLIPALVATPVLYSWAHGGGSVLPSVAHIYLNVPSFIARSIIAFAGWTILAVAVPRTDGARGTLLAALGLVFYCVLISLVPVDWILSLEHPFVSESFGASLAITQLVAALAWIAVLAPSENEGVEGDLGGLLLAMVLAITYVDFMALLVIWYGDLPDRVFWFVERDRAPWSLLAMLAFVLGSGVPIILLLLARVRNSGSALRVVGGIELVGLAAYNMYLVVPPFGWPALVAAALALVAIGAFLLGLLLADVPAIALGARRSSHVR